MKEEDEEEERMKESDGIFERMDGMEVEEMRVSGSRAVREGSGGLSPTAS